jgi:hypothetical protein
MKIKMGRALMVLVLSLLAAWSCEAQSSNTLVFDVTGLIDTADFLIIHDGTLQWHHTGSGAAVGRHSGANEPTVISTSLDGLVVMSQVSWIPTWPQPPPNEIRFDALSSVFSPLSPGLSSEGILSVSASTLSGRGNVSITQVPSAANDFTLIAQFADGFSGAASLQGQITVVAVPEPAPWLLFITGLVMAFVVVRWRHCQTARARIAK